MDFFRLFLKTPLYYRREKINPFTAAGAMVPRLSEDLLFCFDLDLRQARRIDPSPEQYLGPLAASGRKFSDAGQVLCPEGIQTPAAEETALELALGLYYGVQFRGFDLSGFAGTALECAGQEYFTRADFIETAMELQKEGLWERQKLENRIYLRRLFEDGAPVIQILRPLQTPGPLQTPLP
ncbi:MAG: hypothetical protein LBP60_06305 [Spirochaetaceae bacterium]|jgi:hypothetical protein|nr:hypothetical protein [Spirochaetaceae bacterium]